MSGKKRAPPNKTSKRGKQKEYEETPQQQPEKISFKPYDPVTLHTDPDTGKWMNPSILFFGGRRTGKSTKGKELFYRIRKKFAIAFLWSLTGLGTRVFGDAFYNVFCFPTLEIKQVELAIGLMKWLRVAYPNGIYGLDLNALFTFDDCGSVKESRDKVINQLASNGRNDNITPCHMLQKLSQVSPDTRSGSEVFITNYIYDPDDKVDAYKTFFKDSIQDYDLFCACLERYTKKYGSLVKTPRNLESSHFTDWIFSFKIRKEDPTPPFTIRSPFMDVIAMAFQASAENVQQQMFNKFQNQTKARNLARLKEEAREQKILMEAQRHEEDMMDEDDGEESDEEDGEQNDDEVAHQKKRGKQQTRKSVEAKSSSKQRKSVGEKAGKQQKAKDSKTSKSKLQEQMKGTTSDDDNGIQEAVVDGDENKAKTKRKKSKYKQKASDNSENSDDEEREKKEKKVEVVKTKSGLTVAFDDEEEDALERPKEIDDDDALPSFYASSMGV